MLEIILENESRIPIFGKSLLIISASSLNCSIMNNEDDYDIIVISGGIDRTVNVELHQPAIIIIEGGIRTTINVTGGMALPISQAVFVGGIDNVVNGIANQNKGKITMINGETFIFGALSVFKKISIS
jgi:hypothetical protein